MIEYLKIAALILFLLVGLFAPQLYRPVYWHATCIAYSDEPITNQE